MVCLGCICEAVVARNPTTTAPNTPIPLMLLILVYPDTHVYLVNVNSTINITKAGCIRWTDSISVCDFNPPRLFQRQ